MKTINLPLKYVMMKPIFFQTGLIYILLSVLQLQAETLSQGKSLYDAGKYAEAQKIYNQAQVKDPNSPELFFNQGTLLYKQNKFQEAHDLFLRATQSTDPKVEASAYYNMGNALVRLGKLTESLESYKKSLEINPDNPDCQHNIEWVQKKIKEELDKKKEEQKNQEEKQNKQDQKEANQAQAEEKQAQEQKQAGKKSGDQKEGQEASKKEEENASDQKSNQDQNQAQGEEAESEDKKRKEEKQQAVEEDKNKPELKKDETKKLQTAEKQKDADNKNEEKKEGKSGEENQLNEEEAERLLKMVEQQPHGKYNPIAVEKERKESTPSYKDW